MLARRDTTPLNVLHVFSGDLWAGAEVVIFTLLRRLRRYPDLRILALSLNDGLLATKLRQIGIETHVIPEDRHAFPSICLRTARLLRTERIDIIHSHRYKENLLALVLSRLLGTRRLVTTLHGSPEPYGAEGRWSRLIARLNYPVMGRCFSCVVTVSQEISGALTSSHGFCPDRLAVIHNGIEIDWGPPTDSRGDRRPPENTPLHVGTVGRLVPVKDFALFLEIAAVVKKELPNARFTILGDGPLKDDLIRKAGELELDGGVEFLPGRQDPVPYYESLDLYLNTSVHEGIPLSILEAMACGVPVIAARVGGIPEIIRHESEGYLVSGRDPRAYAETCIQLLTNGDLRHCIAARARERVERHFSAARMAEAYHSLYITRS